MNQKAILIFFLLILLIGGCKQKKDFEIIELIDEEHIEIIGETAGGVGTLPKFAIQYPAGTDLFNVSKEGNVVFKGNATMADGFNIDRINSTTIKIWIG